jgi:hypothetical protein
MIAILPAAVLVALFVFAVAKLGLVLALILLVLALILIPACQWAWVPTGRLPRHRVRHHRLRLRLRLHPGRGHATLFELWLRWGRLSAFRHSGRTRGSLAFWQRIAAAPAAYSLMVGRGHYRHALRVGLDEHVLVIAAPRTGKTGWLARVILHYPGAVVSTTTKHDVFEHTAGVRGRRGPVQVFNPQQVGNVPSTFRWNPLEGCEHPATAIRRADAFATSVSQKGVEEGTFWTSKASDFLRATFMAAALAGGDMRLVARWVLSGDARDAEQILAEHGRQDWAALLTELRSDAQKTAQTIRMTMSRSLAFLADPALAACVLPAPGAGLDIGQFLEQRGTLYLIAESRGEESPVAPLFACLSSEIHYTAGLLGSQSPAGKLDPPLLMALDEVTQICPVPVPSWLADSGGKGIQVAVVAHGEAQLRNRWGKDGARVIMDTTGAKLYLPGITDTETLAAASKLCGTAALRERGADEHTRHAVMEPEMISRLPGSYALVIRGGHAPVIARLQMVWQDRAYRAARRRGLTGTALTAALQQAIIAAERPALPVADVVQPAAADFAPVEEVPAPSASAEPVRVPDDLGDQFPWTRP